jgi:hypothetical protein
MEPSSTDLTLYRVNKGHSTCAADVAQALSGQTLADWSAIYAQYTIEHAERYLPNRWDDTTTAELIELRVAKDKSIHYTSENEIRIVPLLDDWMRESGKSSAEKAEMVRQALKERFGI